MTTPVQGGGAGVAVSPVAGLAEAIDSILDKGLVIDAFVRVSLIGIELLTIEARIVVASVDTYLRFAEAVSQVSGSAQHEGWPLLESHRLARHLTEGPVGGTALAAARAPLEAGTATAAHAQP
jgi:hypothetical protein